MKLFEASWAPSPRRVKIYLAEKGIEVERVAVDLRSGEHLEAGFIAVNPQRQLPVLQLDDGTLIDDSHGICRYFEALHPDPPLFGRTPGEIGVIESWLRRIDHDCFQAAVLALRNRSPAFADRAVSGQWPAIAQIPDLIERGRCMWSAFADVLDRHLDGRAFIATDRFTIADIMALVAIDFGIATKLPDPREGRAALAGWHAAISARPSASA